MKIDIQQILSLHPDIKEDVLKLMLKIEKIDNGPYYPKIQSAVVAEIMAAIYNDDSVRPKNASRGDYMKIKYEKAD